MSDLTGESITAEMLDYARTLSSAETMGALSCLLINLASRLTDNAVDDATARVDGVFGLGAVNALMARLHMNGTPTTHDACPGFMTFLTSLQERIRDAAQGGEPS